MKPGRIKLWLAVALLVGAFTFAAVHLLRSRAAAVVDPSIEVIRFAHWQLEPGVREAFNAIAADYMKLHPKVRVEQMDIPGRAWKQWLRTRLIGGTAPDLIELASYENPDDMLARYFTPITSYLEQPNPYNADEPDLRDLSWRRSYAAELVPTTVELGHYYNSNLLEYYGAPSTLVTVRIFYNRELMHAAVGDRPMPRTFDEFVTLCADLQKYARESGRSFAPLAGSIYNITKLTDGLFNSVTQKLGIELDYGHDLELSRHEALVSYVRGRWSFRTPAVRTSLQTVEAFGRYMEPGWVQLGRESSMLQFLQGRAAMLATGTWDAGGIYLQANFPIGAFRVPSFRRDDPKYGAWTLGPLSEASTYAAVPFGLTRGSKHPERAIDFLRFLTSRKSNAKFAQISKWLPVIKGVPVPEDTQIFSPVQDGYVGGVNIRAMSGQGNETLMQYIHLLSGEHASADTFIDQTKSSYDKAFYEEIAKMAKINLDTLRQKDSVLIGLYERERAEGLARSKFDRMVGNQLDNEAQRLQGLRTLADYPAQE